MSGYAAGPTGSPRATAVATLRVVAVALFVVAVLAAAGALVSRASGGDSTTGGPGPAAAAPVPAAQPPASSTPTRSHAVTYQLVGKAAASNITYVERGSNIVQRRSATAPWSVSFTRQAPAGSSAYYSVSAQNNGGGTLGCRITVDGQLVIANTTAGKGSVVLCSASVR